VGLISPFAWPQIERDTIQFVALCSKRLKLFGFPHRFSPLFGTEQTWHKLNCFKFCWIAFPMTAKRSQYDKLEPLGMSCGWVLEGLRLGVVLSCSGCAEVWVLWPTHSQIERSLNGGLCLHMWAFPVDSAADNCGPNGDVSWPTLWITHSPLLFPDKQTPLINGN